MDNPTPVPAPQKKFFTRPMILIFLIGLLLGVALFASYSYFRLARQFSTANQSNTQTLAPGPVSFDLTAADHIWGNKDAATTLVVFADLTCPYCREYHKNLEELMSTRADKMRLVWKHLPLSLNNVDSISSATAAECAGEQGKFFEYVSQLYKNQDKFSPEFYQSVAADLGLDKEALASCQASGRYDDKIKADYNEGLAKGVTGAPASFLNGRYLAGTLPLAQLEALIDPLIK